jgi:hypothetical protein
MSKILDFFKKKKVSDAAKIWLVYTEAFEYFLQKREITVGSCDVDLPPFVYARDEALNYVLEIINREKLNKKYRACVFKLRANKEFKKLNALGIA